MTGSPPPITPADHPAGEPVSDADRLRGALKKSASALKADGVPFALAGGYALWVHGAPERTHDVDPVAATVARRARAAGLAADRAQTADKPFAAAFLVLAERLGIIDQGGAEVNTDSSGGSPQAELALPAV